MKYLYNGCYHLSPILKPAQRAQQLKNAENTLRPRLEEFDTIVVSGMSGVLFGATLAYILDKPLLLVRKENDTTAHGARRLEGNHGLERYLFVDDMIASGDTLRYCIDQIDAELPQAKIMGVYTFDTNELWYAGYLVRTYGVSTLSTVLPEGSGTEPVRGL